MKACTGLCSGLFTAALVAGSTSASAEVRRYEARAYDLRSGRLLYTEYHTESRKNGRHLGSTVVYRQADGAVIARKQISYRKSLVAPDFSFRDLRTGYMEALEFTGGRARMQARRTSAEELQVKNLTLPRPLVVDAGFDNFIRLKWDRLIAGRPVETNFAVPIELDYYRFKIVKIADVRVSGRPAARFRFAPANPVLALVAGHIDVDYDLATRRLLVYRGISNINDADGKSYKARIVFSYAADGTLGAIPDCGITVTAFRAQP